MFAVTIYFVFIILYYLCLYFSGYNVFINAMSISSDSKPRE